MLEWIKYFFGNFFSKKYAEQSEQRGFGNCLLSFLLALVLMLTTFVLATGWAFPTHYGNSKDFSKYYHGLFEGENALQLSIAESKMTAKSAGGEDVGVINTFLSQEDAAKYSDGKYNLVVDTREINSLYNDFKAEFVNKDNKDDVLTYDQYVALDKDNAAKYSFKLTYTEKTVDLNTESVASFAEFISQNGTDNQKKSLGELQTDGVVTAENYNKAYELYFAVKYAKIGNGLLRAPTMRDYYISTYLATNADGSNVYDNFVIFLRDLALVAWHNDSDQLMAVTGYYGKEAMTVDGANTAEKADKLLKSVYFANTDAMTINYFLYLMRGALMFILVWAVFVVLARIIGSLAKIESLCDFGGLFKTSGAFWLGATIPTVLFILIGEFFLSQTYVFYLALGVELMTMLVRSVVHYVPLFIEESRKKKEEAAKAEQQNGANA